MSLAADRTADRYQPLIELARQREESAALALAESLRLEANAADRQRELQQYEGEYGARVPVGVCGPAALARHAQFLAKLREAVSFQALRLTELQHRAQQAREHWLAAHHKVEKLEQLKAALAQQQRQHEQRRADREQDDRNSFQHRGALAA